MEPMERTKGHSGEGEDRGCTGSVLVEIGMLGLVVHTWRAYESSWSTVWRLTAIAWIPEKNTIRAYINGLVNVWLRVCFPGTLCMTFNGLGTECCCDHDHASEMSRRLSEKRLDSSTSVSGASKPSLTTSEFDRSSETLNILVLVHLYIYQPLSSGHCSGTEASGITVVLALVL